MLGAAEDARGEAVGTAPREEGPQAGQGEEVDADTEDRHAS